MKFKEILYDSLEGSELSEEWERLLNLKEVVYSGKVKICENGEKQVHMDRESGEVIEVKEKLQPELPKKFIGNFSQKNICRPPSETERNYSGNNSYR